MYTIATAKVQHAYNPHNVYFTECLLCICFVAYKVYKELERTLRLMKIDMSVDKMLLIAKTIPTII